MGSHSFFTLDNIDGTFVDDCGYRYIETPYSSYFYYLGSEGMDSIHNVVFIGDGDGIYRSHEVISSLLSLKAFVVNNRETLRNSPDWKGWKGITPEDVIQAIDRLLRTLKTLASDTLVEVLERIDE